MNIPSPRDQIFEIVKKELIGPDPIEWDGLIQDDGEEILVGDPPLTRYVAGILYPQKFRLEETEEQISDFEEEPFIEESDDDELEDQELKNSREYLEDAEELINLSNAFRPSAMSLTVAIEKGDNIDAEIRTGFYIQDKSTNQETNKDVAIYKRSQIIWNNQGRNINLPTRANGLVEYKVPNAELRFVFTYRHKVSEALDLFTITLENTRIASSDTMKDKECYFQVGFSLFSQKGFKTLPDSFKSQNPEDRDYLSNKLLYRNIGNYAIGHGCAANWERNNGIVSKIETSTFPVFDMKPIVPSQITGVKLSMKEFYDPEKANETIENLTMLCSQYEKWIQSLENEATSLIPDYQDTADSHITQCKKVLDRMKRGVELLEIDKLVAKAFRLMNKAMLLQQLHSKLPLQEWVLEEGKVDLKNRVEMPDLDNFSTWYEGEKNVYGQWRPFQIAFVLMNLESMSIETSPERRFVDLIWFPTGGGKTEAYLGLSAFTIFIRKLKNINDFGTTILMRYTLRLLTAQQYQRAASLICACELIREQQTDLLGQNRISIGLWVGESTTPNKRSKAISAFKELKKDKNAVNPFLVLKCPWCGAEMGPIEGHNGSIEVMGYRTTKNRRGKENIIFQCSNSSCHFSHNETHLPLYVVDEDIYENTPTLILGTVDKFAMLPFLPQAQSIFGYDYENGGKVTSPSLIIQDELHLISGPLGSMVGLYETLVYELCISENLENPTYPKIIASTATISRAREQCHALYGCKEENVFQFPPPGLLASDSFFAHENQEQNGRMYVGILASGASSETTVAIRLYASLLYAGKEIIVENEASRDPYWTNIGYFNSIRELGNAATWIRADIEQYLDTIYKRQYYDKRYSKEGEYQEKRRYISKYSELTSRIRSDKVTENLKDLEVEYAPSKSGEEEGSTTPLDICLATNMISVGLDVSRLGLMTVSGQPKTTSEYIQATSRVGRDSTNAPGIIFILYKAGRPRDKSHYEQFANYHSKIYSYVEPTSVTPFSPQVRERALHAILVGLIRLQKDKTYNESRPTSPPINDILQPIVSKIKDRVELIDADELGDAEAYVSKIIRQWNDWSPKKFHDFKNQEDLPLLYPSGSIPNPKWNSQGFATPTSMRNVDAECKIQIVPNSCVIEESTEE